MNESDGRRVDALLACLLLAGALLHRVPRLDLVPLNADTLGPYLKAWTILSGGSLLPTPHAPESGPALYWLSALFMWGADSLREVLERRFVFQALAAPAVYLALASRIGRPGAVVAAAAMAGSVGLSATLESGYQGYLAPDLGAAVAVCLAVGLLGGTRAVPIAAALPLVPVAMMCHPFAVALLPPVVVASVWAYRADPGGRRYLAAGLVVAVVLGGVRIAQLLGAPSGEAWTNAVSNASGAGTFDVLTGALLALPRQNGALDTLVLVLPLLVLVMGPTRGTKRLAALYTAGACSLAVAGSTIGYLQPYHLRILFPLAVVTVVAAAARGLSLPARARPAFVAFVLALLFGSAWWWSRPLRAESSPSDLEAHAILYEAVAADPSAGRWIEFATVGKRSWGSPTALVLEAGLRGDDLDAFRRPGPLYLAVAAPSEEASRLDDVPDGAGRTLAALDVDRHAPKRVRLVRLDGPSRSVPWTRAACDGLAPLPLRVERKSADWLTFLRPGYTAEFTARWFDACVGGGE